MNTPAHVVASLLVFGRDRPAESATPIIVGSLIPDGIGGVVALHALYIAFGLLFLVSRS